MGEIKYVKRRKAENKTMNMQASHIWGQLYRD